MGKYTSEFMFFKRENERTEWNERENEEKETNNNIEWKQQKQRKKIKIKNGAKKKEITKGAKSHKSLWIK